MPLKVYKPTSAGRRGMTGYTFEEITKSRPERSLTEPLRRKGGRNNLGRGTVRHRGGGHKRRYRIIGFKRNKVDFRAELLRLIDEASERMACHVMFLVDDIVFTRRFTGEPMIEQIENDEDILAVSLRLGDNIPYCPSLGIESGPPELFCGRRGARRDPGSVRGWGPWAAGNRARRGRGAGARPRRGRGVSPPDGPAPGRSGSTR